MSILELPWILFSHHPLSLTQRGTRSLMLWTTDSSLYSMSATTQQNWRISQSMTTCMESSRRKSAAMRARMKMLRTKQPASEYKSDCLLTVTVQVGLPPSLTKIIFTPDLIQKRLSSSLNQPFWRHNWPTSNVLYYMLRQLGRSQSAAIELLRDRDTKCGGKECSNKHILEAAKFMTEVSRVSTNEY